MATALDVLIRRAQDPQIVALVDSWGPATTEELEVIRQVMGGAHRTRQELSVA